MSQKNIVIAVCAVIAIVLVVWLVSPNREEQAMSQLEAAAKVEQSGKFDEAITLYQTVIAEYADTGAAGLAESSILRVEKYKERKAIQEVPEILFITSAGNSDNDVTFDEFYPSSYDYPNILSVGAVDSEGNETSFTSLGKVEVYANGFEVESYVPGGNRLNLSGTSMATPQVLNLAGKLLALDPELTPSDLRRLILEGADTKQLESREIRLMNPKRSLELLKGA